MITLSLFDQQGTQQVRSIDTQLLLHWVSVARNEIESCVAELHARHDAAGTPMSGFADIVNANLTKQLSQLDHLTETLDMMDDSVFWSRNPVSIE